MTYKIQTTNTPDDVKDLIEVDDAEFIDLQRMGLVRPGKGDIDDQGRLKKSAAKDAPADVVTAFPTGPIPVTTPPAA